MTHRLSLEERPLIQNFYQPAGKKRWLAASIVSLGGTGGVGYVAVKSFIAKAILNGAILTAGSFICAGACAYCCYRFVTALRDYHIEPISPTFDVEASKANDLMLRAIHKRLNKLLNPMIDIEANIDCNKLLVDLEESLDPIKLRESIHQQLIQIEDLIPDLEDQLTECKELIESGISNKSFGSPSTVNIFDSPSGDVSFESKLFNKVNELSKQVRGRRSNSSSRSNSAYNSPMVIKTTSNVPLTSSIEKPKAPKLDYSLTINDGHESDSDEKKRKKTEIHL